MVTLRETGCVYLPVKLSLNNQKTLSTLNSYWQNRLTKNFSLSGVGFDGVGEAYNSWLYRLRAKHFNSLIRKHIGHEIKSFHAIDVGTGTGFYLKLLLKSRVNNLEAIDFNSISISTLPTHFQSVTFHSFDISQELPHQLIGKFDLVVCADVLFHIVNNELYTKAIQNLSRLLKINGKLIITENLSKKREERGHIVDRTHEEVYTQLQTCGFKIQEERSLFVLMNKPFKSNHPLLVKFSAWRVRLLKSNKERGRESLNYFIGMFLYGIEIVSSFFFIKGNGTSFIVCSKLTERTHHRDSPLPKPTVSR